MKIGRYEIDLIDCDHFALDGGSMFGSVPKPLWSKSIAADDRNRIPLSCRVLVLRDGQRTILVDCGVGRIFSDKLRDIYAVDNRASLEQLAPTDIILTHLHFDHAGGITRLDVNGKPQLAFPSAEIHLQRKNLEHARAPGPRERASYLPEVVEPLAGAKLRLVDGAGEILPGIEVRVANGHTHGLQCVLIRDGKECLAFPSDLVPTAHHVPIPYVMGYDLCAETTMREKKEFLLEAVRENWTVVFEHDRDTPAGKIASADGERFTVSRVAA